MPGLAVIFTAILAAILAGEVDFGGGDGTGVESAAGPHRQIAVWQQWIADQTH